MVQRSKDRTFFPKLKRGMGVVAHPWLRSETGHRPFGEHRVQDRGGEHRAPYLGVPQMGGFNMGRTQVARFHLDSTLGLAQGLLGTKEEIQ